MKELTKKEIRELLIRNSCLMTLNEGKLIFDLAKSSNGDIIEIGSYKGGSTIILAKALKNPYLVFSIDPHDQTIYFNKEDSNKDFIKFKNIMIPRNTYKSFINNIKENRLEKNIVPIVKTSFEANKSWNKKASFLLIDGDHKYENAKLDFLLWERHLKLNGIIAFHDSADSENIVPLTGSKHLKFIGPRKVVDERLKNSKRFKHIRTIDTLTYAKKVKESNIIERLRDNLEIKKLVNDNIINRYLYRTFHKLDYILGNFIILLKGGNKL